MSTPYAELHAHSSYSFLDGASQPEELVAEAARLGLEALALTDHDGFYGIVRFAEAARDLGVPTVFGAELTLGRKVEPVGDPDPGGWRHGPTAAGTESHLVVLARNPRGYALLARAISEAQLAGGRGAPRFSLERLALLGGAGAPPADRGHWVVLTGCRKGAVPAALVTAGPHAAGRELGRLVELFGRDNVAVELWEHGQPLDSHRNDALSLLATTSDVAVVATTNAHYASPSRWRLASAVAALSARRSLDEMDGWLPPGPGAHLRSGAEQERRFARYPGAVGNAAELGRACAFDLKLVAPRLPPFPCPDGLDENAYLRRLASEGMNRRYGPRPPARPGDPSSDDRTRRAWEQLDHELHVIEQLGFPGYFLVVWEMVELCREKGILCQGRGSAANSVVCFALGITKVDPIRYGLLFERFLAPERDGELAPDIDIDIESGRREEVIQHVYRRYGRHNTAQVANVISYRPRSAVRDAARVLGYAPGQQDAWARAIGRRAGVSDDGRVVPDEVDGHPRLGGPPGGGGAGGGDGGGGLPDDVATLAGAGHALPPPHGNPTRGLVICDRPVVEVCPVEWARMEDRSVLQWDKDDCGAVGLVKFDLLGLGMLEAIHHMVDLVAEAHGTVIDLADLGDDDPRVYEMLSRADSIGVFQVESRAQMSILPRLRPREFYDLVVEVALIRPGPIQGGSVHPYIRRRNGTEEITYPHPLLKPALEKTLGVPLFQEQLMRIAVDAAGFTPSEADQLRQAMGSKRSAERMERLRERLFSGMAANGITGEVADDVFDKLSAFSTYGFPESHSISFAYIVYASAWIKYHYHAAFTAGLLNAQPMGFYSPHSLVQDARRHGVEVRKPDVNSSAAKAGLEWDPEPRPHSTTPENEPPRPQPAIRLGLSSVRTVNDDLAERISAERRSGGPYSDVEDLVRRVPVKPAALEALATAGALETLAGSAASSTRGRAGNGGDGSEPHPALDRRRALWAAGAAAQAGPDRLRGVVTALDAPTLPGMSPEELAAADMWSTGISYEGHPTRFARHALDRSGVVTVSALSGLPHRSRVRVAGIVTHRQRPPTAGGVTFLTLEDETGVLNVICSPGCWKRHARILRNFPALVIGGRLERADGAINLTAQKVEPLSLSTAAPPSRDFR